MLDGKEFILENCHRSSILNPRSFFIDENSFVFARAAKASIVLEISINDLNKLLPDSPLFEKKFLSYQLKILNSGRIFPIDYDYKLPKKLKIEKDFDQAKMERLIHAKTIGKLLPII